jgi:pimeloyl-ACP methyl ester carboxylesterase
MRITAAVLLATTLSAQPSTDPPAPGKLIDIGGRRLHLYCTGTGPQTVIIENGGGAFSIDWSLVQPDVSKFARVCTYDRAGYAWSDPGPAPDMVGQIADDLRLLLRTARLSPPYILVGASIGGFYARAYQRRFPDEVSGMVMVDGTTEEGLAWTVNGQTKPAYAMTREDMNTAMAELLAKPAPPAPSEASAIEEPFNRLPKNVQAVRAWAVKLGVPHGTFRPSIGAASEATREEFVAQRTIRLSGEHPFGALPLIVVTRGRNTNPTRIQQHREVANLSSLGKLVVADNSGHEIHLYRPDVVIQAIREIVLLAGRRSRRPVAGERAETAGSCAALSSDLLAAVERARERK